LKFVQESLDYLPGKESAIEYLAKVHAKYLPEGMAVPEPEAAAPSQVDETARRA
jgi:hypothetical protein